MKENLDEFLAENLKDGIFEAHNKGPDEHARQNFIVNTNISGFRFSDSEIFLAHACILA